MGDMSRRDEWKHGANCYANHGCRCEICMKGYREKWRAFRKKKREERRLLLSPEINEWV